MLRSPTIAYFGMWKCYVCSHLCNFMINLVMQCCSYDRGKGVPSFDEMVAIVFGGVDFDDPTTNMRGRRALAIAKPTPGGY